MIINSSSQFYSFCHPTVALLAFRLPSYFLRHQLPRGSGYHPVRFSVWFKILYSVIQRLIQHCLLSKMVYLNIKYVIAARNYELFNAGTYP